MILSNAFRERAYKIWEENGRPDGREIEHWLQAERDLSRDRGQAPDITAFRTFPAGERGLGKV